MRAFFFPSRLAHLWYVTPKIVFLVCDAAQATCTSVVRSHWLPLVVRLLRRFPALSLWPGHRPAHDARCPAVANWLMSAPISATITSADWRPTPGILISR